MNNNLVINNNKGVKELVKKMKEENKNRNSNVRRG